MYFCNLIHTLHHRTMMPPGFSINSSICTGGREATVPCLKMWSFTMLRMESSNWADKQGTSTSKGTSGKLRKQSSYVQDMLNMVMKMQGLFNHMLLESSRPQ